MEFRAIIQDGTFKMPDLKKFNGKDCIISINEYKLNRNLEQNKLYWARLKELASESGYTKTELHEYFKYIYIALPLFHRLNRELPFLTIDKHIELSKNSDIMQDVNILITSTKLNTKEFAEYMKEVEKWSLENYDLDLTFITGE